MSCEQDLVLAFLEEDNIQRAYFRVKPLLSIHGDVQEEALQRWPDQGCLRIVPDRNEQHTFKDRMRSLGSFCMMNLVGIPEEANKIRTNKNYRPERGEYNQFILYSDTVQALPEHTFFEVLEGAAADFAVLAQASITPLFYIREGDTLYGPVRKASAEKPETAGEAAGTLYSILCPDQQQHLILCMETPADALIRPDVPEAAPKKEAVPAAIPAINAAPPAAAAPVAPVKDAPLPIGKPLEILDSSKGFEETLREIAQPLTKGANLLREQTTKPLMQPKRQRSPLLGTPLYQSPLRTSLPQPKNKLQEVVSSQWRVARNEPPAAPLPSGVTMHHVENPVEVACTHLRQAWLMEESRMQLVDFILSMEGMRSYLDPASATAKTTPLQRVLQARLEDLEAERLTALVQLDKAHADLESFRRDSLAALSAKTRAESDALLATKAQLEDSVDDVKHQLNTLTVQRDDLLHQVDDLSHNALPAALAKALNDAAVTAPVHGIPLRMSGVTGQTTPLDDMVARIQHVCDEVNVHLSRNACIALLVLLGMSPRIGLTAPSMAAAGTLMGNIVHAMGWQQGYQVQVSSQQTPLVAHHPEDTTPCLLLSTLPDYGVLWGATSLFLGSDMTASTAYQLDAWPIYPLPTSSFIAEKHDAAEPVSAASLLALTREGKVTDAEIQTVLGNILAAACPLSGKAYKAMCQFITACSALMEGGLPVACDWALLLWIIPANRSRAEALLPMLEEYPLARGAWSE